MLLRTTLRPRALRLATCRSIRLISSPPLIRIKNATFYKQHPTTKDSSNPPLFPKLDFTLPSQRVASEQGSALEHWGIIGLSDRTDFLQILRGQHISVPAHARSYPYLRPDENPTKDPSLLSVSNAIQYVGFCGEDSKAIDGTRGAYLGARYESHREETDWTLQQFLRGQTSLNPMEGEEKGTMHDEGFLKQVIDDLHLGDFLDMPVQNLSNGQKRRAQIAKALLRKPELLLLDEPFMGLDPATARSISGLLHQLAEKGAPRIIMALRPHDQLPDWITHTMVLGTDHKVLIQGPKSQVERTLDVWTHLFKGGDRDSLEYHKGRLFDRYKRDLENGVLNEDLLRNLVGHRIPDRKKSLRANLGGEPLIEMEGVRVQYGEKVVLGDWNQKVNGLSKKGLHWRVRRGQRWAILGANGSGKTTLLSLITSDHPQAYAQPVKLFGRSRVPEPGVPGISIFELQSRIGHSSPELHAFFPRQLTIREALESAFAETVFSKPKLNPKIDDSVSAWLEFWKHELDPNYSAEEIPEVSTAIFPKLRKVVVAGRYVKFSPIDDIVQYADEIKFGELSVAHQRIVLFLRAQIARPDIVILDEALSGLSALQRDKCLKFLDNGMVPFKKPVIRNRSSVEPKYEYTGLSEDQALVVISHVAEEIPESVRFYMRLPSDPGAGEEALDFRFGMLQSLGSLRFPDIWAEAWAPPSQFKPRRTWRRNSEVMDMQDFSEFEWWTL